VVRAALDFHLVIYFVLTITILTTNKSLIIRTTIRMTIRERENKIFISWLFRPIIGRFRNKSRGTDKFGSQISKYAKFPL